MPAEAPPCRLDRLNSFKSLRRWSSAPGNDM
jgi:hypothetical protein